MLLLSRVNDMQYDKDPAMKKPARAARGTGRKERSLGTGIAAHACLSRISKRGETKPYSVQPRKVAIAPHIIACSPEE